MNTKLKNTIDLANEFTNNGNFAGARVALRSAIQLALSDDLLALADQLKEKLTSVETASKLEVEKLLKEQNEADTRRAYCVNKVNYNHMRLAKKVAEFLAVNPPQNKVDGSFTKKYVETIQKFKCELNELIDGSEVEFDLYRYQYNLEMLELTLKSRYVNTKGQRTVYATNERIRANDTNLLVLATDRTADVYWQAEKDLKEKQQQLLDLESQISALKRIVQEGK